MWGGRHGGWPERPARPAVRKLEAQETHAVVDGLTAAIQASPVLTALRYRVQARRGRFYYESEGDVAGDFAVVARVTPLADDAASFLLEVEQGSGSWSTVFKGAVRGVGKCVGGTARGRFTGWGGSMPASARPPPKIVPACFLNGVSRFAIMRFPRARRSAFPRCCTMCSRCRFPSLPNPGAGTSATGRRASVKLTKRRVVFLWSLPQRPLWASLLAGDVSIADTTANGMRFGSSRTRARRSLRL